VSARAALDHLQGKQQRAKDLCVRRQQADADVVRAQGRLHQAEVDAVFAVTGTYLAVLYALEQREMLGMEIVLAKDLRNNFESRPDVAAQDVDRITSLIDAVEARRVEADVGIGRALAALREAMGVGPAFCLQPADSQLPLVDRPVCCEEVVALALA